MPTMKDVGDDKDTPTKRNSMGKETPLSKLDKKKSVGDDHYDVTGPKSAKAYYTSGFGYNGENVKEPGDGANPHIQKQGLTTDQRMPHPTTNEDQSDFTHPGPIMDVGGARKVTPDSRYPYDAENAGAEDITEAPEGKYDAMSILVWVLGGNSGVWDTTWGEFLQQNPDIAEQGQECQAILDTLLAGRTHQERTPEGVLGIKKAEGNTMKKTNEDATVGAVSAGNIGTGSPNALFTTNRVKEEEGDAPALEDADDDLAEGDMIEFRRNNVPYRGKVIEVYQNSVVISTAGRRLVVEKETLADQPGAPEPASFGTVEYGHRTAKQTHAASSSTNPNDTIKQFIGSEGLGDDGEPAQQVGDGYAAVESKGGSAPPAMPFPDMSRGVGKTIGMKRGGLSAERIMEEPGDSDDDAPEEDTDESMGGAF